MNKLLTQEERLKLACKIYKKNNTSLEHHYRMSINLEQVMVWLEKVCKCYISFVCMNLTKEIRVLENNFEFKRLCEMTDFIN